MGAVDRRQRGAPIYSGEPSGVAMGQDLDTGALARLGLTRPAIAVSAVIADGAVDRDILVGDRGGVRQGRGDRLLSRFGAASCFTRSRAQRRLTAVGRVAARRQRRRRSPHLRGLRRSPAPCRRRRWRRSTARPVPACRGSPAPHPPAAPAATIDQLVRQPGLIDDLDRASVGGEPDRAHRLGRRRSSTRSPAQYPAGDGVEAGQAAPGRGARAR